MGLKPMTKRWNSTLEQRTPLKAKKRHGRNSTLRPVSDKQKAKNELWAKITEEKCYETGFICLWCGKPGQRNDRTRIDYLNGHHTRKPRRNHNKIEFCYPIHEFRCHQEIEDNNVDVELYPNREAWLRSKNNG